MLHKYSQLVEEGQSCSRDTHVLMQSADTIHAHINPPVVLALECSKCFTMCLKQSLVFLSLKLGLCRAEPQMLLCSSNHVLNTLSPAYFQIFLLDRVVSSMICHDFLRGTSWARLKTHDLASLCLDFRIRTVLVKPVLTRSLREQFHYQQPVAGRGVLGNGVPRKKCSKDSHKTHSCL